jgi:hypothetical protein
MTPRCQDLHFSTIASYWRIEFCARPGILIEMDQFIFIGNVSSSALGRTRMAKSFLDCGWGSKDAIVILGEYAGRCARIVDERNTTRACSSCGPLSGALRRKWAACKSLDMFGGAVYPRIAT